jgi:hypothetical protein
MAETAIAIEQQANRDAKKRNVRSRAHWAIDLSGCNATPQKKQPGIRDGRRATGLLQRARCSRLKRWGGTSSEGQPDPSCQIANPSPFDNGVIWPSFAKRALVGTWPGEGHRKFSSPLASTRPLRPGIRGFLHQARELGRHRADQGLLGRQWKVRLAAQDPVGEERASPWQGRARPRRVEHLAQGDRADVPLANDVQRGRLDARPGSAQNDHPGSGGYSPVPVALKRAE